MTMHFRQCHGNPFKMSTPFWHLLTIIIQVTKSAQYVHIQAVLLIKLCTFDAGQSKSAAGRPGNPLPKFLDPPLTET